MAVPWLLWAFVRLTGIEWGFPLVPLMAYTPYAAFASVVPVVVALVLRRWVPAVAAALAGVALLAVVAPRFFGDAYRADASGYTGEVRLRVVSANIYRGDADLEELMALVRETGADVLSVQELTAGASRRLDALGLREQLPHRVRIINGKYFGGGVFSRFPLRRLEPIVAPPRFAATGRLLEMPRAVVEVPGAYVEVTAAHPHAPVSGAVDWWVDGLDAFPGAGEGRMRLLIGDFNATLDHDEFRELLGRGYRDAGEVLGEGLKPTWQAGSVIPPPVTIDHVLADERIGIADYEVHDLPGSDHEALSATLVLPRNRGYFD